MRGETVASCENALALLADRLDGALDPSGGPLLDDHLAACDACREVALLAPIGQRAMAVLPRHRCPGRVRAAVFHQLATRGQRRQGISGLAIWASAAAALLACVVAWHARTSAPRPDSSDDREPARAARADLKRAEHEVAAVFGMLHSLGTQGAALAGEEVLNQGVVAPTRKLTLALRESARGLGPSLTGRLVPRRGR